MTYFLRVGIGEGSRAKVCSLMPFILVNRGAYEKGRGLTDASLLAITIQSHKAGGGARVFEYSVEGEHLQREGEQIILQPFPDQNRQLQTRSEN